MFSKVILSLLMVSTVIMMGSDSFAQVGASGRPAKSFSRSFGKTGLLLDVGVYYGQTEATANPVSNNQWQSTTSIYDLTLGYIMENNFYLGGEYSTRSDNQISLNSSFGNSSAIGAGYFADNGFYLTGFYRLNDIYGNYSSGSGYKADLGYMVNMTSNFFLGLAMSIRQTTYKSNSTIVNFDSWTRKETYPLLTFGFIIN